MRYRPRPGPAWKVTFGGLDPGGHIHTRSAVSSGRCPGRWGGARTTVGRTARSWVNRYSPTFVILRLTMTIPFHSSGNATLFPDGVPDNRAVCFGKPS